MTPNGARLIARHLNGAEVEITDAVQVLYDCLLGSMDFGSGFLTIEEVIPVAQLAEVCGFERDAANDYVNGELRKAIQYLAKPPKPGGPWSRQDIDRATREQEHKLETAQRLGWRSPEDVKQTRERLPPCSYF